MSKKVESQSRQAAADTAIIEPDGNSSSAPSQQEIAALAYSYWEARGYQGGSSEEDWLQGREGAARTSGERPKHSGTAPSNHGAGRLTSLHLSRQELWALG